MGKIYKYILFSLIIIASIYLTYQHYTDPIYQLKVGTTLNLEDQKIENWGGRFSNEEDLIYIGFRTRLEEGTVIELHVKNIDDGLVEYTNPFIVSRTTDFYYNQIDGFMYTEGHYEVTIYVDDIVLETSTFVIESATE